MSFTSCWILLILFSCWQLLRESVRGVAESILVVASRQLRKFRRARTELARECTQQQDRHWQAQLLTSKPQSSTIGAKLPMHQHWRRSSGLDRCGRWIVSRGSVPPERRSDHCSRGNPQAPHIMTGPRCRGSLSQAINELDPGMENRHSRRNVLGHDATTDTAVHHVCPTHRLFEFVSSSREQLRVASAASRYDLIERRHLWKVIFWNFCLPT